MSGGGVHSRSGLADPARARVVREQFEYGDRGWRCSAEVGRGVAIQRLIVTLRSSSCALTNGGSGFQLRCPRDHAVLIDGVASCPNWRYVVLCGESSVAFVEVVKWWSCRHLLLPSALAVLGRIEGAPLCPKPHRHWTAEAVCT